MHRDEAGTIAAGQVSELGFDVRNRVVVSRAVMLAEESVHATGGPAFTKADVGHGQAIEDGHVDC